MHEKTSTEEVLCWLRYAEAPEGHGDDHVRGLSAKDISDLTGRNYDSVRSAVRRLYRKGEIKFIGYNNLKGRGRPHSLYVLADT